MVHTADWHIGKTLRGKRRDEEQMETLDELREFLAAEHVDILLIAGDVFDSFAPSAEAENIVYNFLHDVSRMNVVPVVVAGNHDSSLRFHAISRLMAIAGVIMVGFLPQDECKPKIIATRERTRARIATCPFVPEAAFLRQEDLTEKESPIATRLYSREMGKILRRISKDFAPDMVNILVGHFLMHGACLGGGERRLYLGENYAVHPHEIPPNINYVALGHIHRYQHIPALSPVYYCGSPLQLDFGEQQSAKGFLFIEAQAGTPCNPTFIPFKSGKKLVELHGDFEEITHLIASDPTLSNAHLKIVLKTAVTELDAAYKLKKNLPNAVEIRKQPIASAVSPIPRGTEWIPKLYEQFYQHHIGQDVPPEIAKEFYDLYRSVSFITEGKER